MDEIGAINSASKNWSTDDYINRQSEGKNNINYRNFKNLEREFKEFKQPIIYQAISGNITNKMKKLAEDGSLICGDSEYTKARELLTNLRRFVEPIQRIEGRIQYVYQAVLFALGEEDVNQEYLLEKLNKYYKHMPYIGQFKDALDGLSDEVYNRRIKSGIEPISLKGNYNRYVIARRRRSVGA